MSLIDIGVNFHSARLMGLGLELLDRAGAAGLSHVLATGTSLRSSQQAFAFAQQIAATPATPATRHPGRPKVFSTAGVHPHTAQDWSVSMKNSLEALWAHDEVVAVGECGLDYNRMFSPKAAQRAAFSAQMDAAARLGKPLFLHCRDAFDDFRAMMVDAVAAGAHGVVHCFTDGEREASAYLELGLDIGITGWVTDEKRGQALRGALSVIPLDRIHLETDAPYLRPKNLGKSTKYNSYNEPALLPYVALAVAQLKEVDLAELKEQTATNSRRMFKLSR